MIGQIISHYRILEKLGGGGMGVVYKAEDTKLKRTVALKFLPPDLTSDPEAKDRFTHEAQAASALDHPNICNVHEIGETEDGQLFIVMASYKGETIKKAIEKGPLDIDRALDIAIQIASGLSRAHEAGIIHRDIKPANIMITDRGEVKILDFGLAKLSGRTLVTKTGSTLGTAAYMSPEQARGELVDARTDIWSLGVVLYEMLTGKRPFENDYEQALVYSILNEQPKPMRGLRAEVPETLEQIVGKAMAKDPQERYQSSEQMLSDLRVVRGVDESSGTIAAAEDMQRKKRRRLIRLSVVSAALATVVLLALFVFWPMAQDELLAANPRSIVVVGFENGTHDKSLDELRITLQEAIITSMADSKYIHVMSRQRMNDILKQMGKKDMEYVDYETGLEICRREGVELIAVGRFDRSGEIYRSDLKLMDVNTLGIVKTCPATGKGTNSFLEIGGQIDILSRQISQGIGVSQRKIEATSQPVQEKSTSSLEAYNLYNRGVQEFGRFSWIDSRRYLEMAVQKDSQFAMAWLHLAYAADWLKDRKTADHAIQKAVSLAPRAPERDQWAIAVYDSTLRASLLGKPGVSEREFLKIRIEKYPREKEFLTDYGSALYYHYGEYDQAIQVLKRALELDRDYPSAWCSLAYAYMGKHDSTNATMALEHYEAASPGDPNPFDSMGNMLDGMGKYEEAEVYYKKALAVNPNWSISSNTLAGGRAAMEDYTGALQWLDTSFARAKDFGSRLEVQYFRAVYYFWLGQLDEADRYAAKCDKLVLDAGQTPDHAWDWLKIWIAYERRQFARCRRTLDLWGEAYVQRDVTGNRRTRELFVEMCRGFISLKEGIADSVTASLARMDNIRAQIPASDTGKAAKALERWYSRYSNLLRSEWLLSNSHPQEALAARLRTGPGAYKSREAGPSAGVENWNYPNWGAMVDIVPRAYLAMGQIDSAIAAYERAIKPRGEIFPRYHYRLAQLYEKKGVKQNAIREYEKFLQIWGKADPIYKEPADARARLATLKREK